MVARNTSYYASVTSVLYAHHLECAEAKNLADRNVKARAKCHRFPPSRKSEPRVARRKGLAEAFDRAYFDRFVTFVRAGGYEHRTRDGRCQLFRFERPRDADFPPKIELLSRRPKLLDGVETALGRLRITDGDYSLSAILLDDDYYQLLEDGVETIDGLPVLGLRYLPVFKMHAWANLTRDKADNRTVHSDEISKHRSDVCKLCSLFEPGKTVELPEAVRREVAGFVDARPWDGNMLRGWHLPVDSEGMADVIRSACP